MRACMLAYTFYESDNRVRRYAETLARRGDTVEAIVLRRVGQPTHDTIGGVSVQRIQTRVKDEKSPIDYLFKILTFFLRSAWLLSRRHLQSRYDVIHVHSVPDFLVLAALIPRLLGASVILDVHDIVPELYASKFKVGQNSLLFRLLVLVEWISVRFSHHVIVANHLWHDRLVKRSAPSPSQCSTILNYPDPSLFHLRPMAATCKNEFVILYPGSLSWHQGVDLVIAAMARVPDQDRKLKLLIVGDGAEHDKLVSMAKELALEDRVTITRGVPLEEVAQLIASADLGVEPKRKRSFANEALSTKILEFMAVGIPVLAANTLTHQLYFNGDQVEYFEAENVDDLAQKLVGLIENSLRLATLRAAGLEFIRHNNWDVKKHEYLDLLDRLTKRRRGGVDAARVSRVA